MRRDRKGTKRDARMDDVRVWMLTCADCGHMGSVTIALRHLRAATLVCSECGVPIVRRTRKPQLPLEPRA